MRVAYQGLPGAYSEEAVLRHFGAEAEPLGWAYSEQVFEAVLRGEAAYGLLPIENSIAGPVGANLDLFLKEDVFMIAEVFLPIRHCLLAPQGTQLEDVITVYSHPMALAQCREFLQSRKLSAIPEFDTAGSAQLVAERGRSGEAAIGSRRCAEAYGLAVLREDIQTIRDNITRFSVFVPAGKVPSGLRMEKTSLAFAAEHRPGALLDCLRRFAENGINLTRLESRPVAEDPFSYVFFVDFLSGLHDGRVKEALSGLEKDARRVKVLGSYPLGSR